MGNDACKGERCNRLQQCEDSDEASEEKEVIDIPLFPGNKSVTFLDVAQAPSSPVGPPKIRAPPGVLMRHRRRQNPIEVTIVRQGTNWRSLGLLVSPDDNPQYLVIDDVRGPSLVTEWNSSIQHHEALRVSPGDHILAVNGVSGNWEEMLNVIQVHAAKPGDVLKLTVM
mmetsp:Transcript_38150/g.82176  ORF Transcript_38150/g.82176 Transcript_38150/m.82176 type:complete len:169 (+) Transcript_38150:77-583(+)